MSARTEDGVALRYGGGYIEVSGHRDSVLVAVETKSVSVVVHLSPEQALALADDLRAAVAAATEVAA